MINITRKDPQNRPTVLEKSSYVAFLHKHLQEYTDDKKDIEKALDYALAEQGKPGGFILVATTKPQEIAAIAVVLNTQMQGFIPEHILVYIATNAQQRGQGVGSKLMQELIDTTQGSIALHVDPTNPAIKLYEKLGFETKYLEMRLTK